jgi:hypothetical protein
VGAAELVGQAAADQQLLDLGVDAAEPQRHPWPASSWWREASTFTPSMSSSAELIDGLGLLPG